VEQCRYTVADSYGHRVLADPHIMGPKVEYEECLPGVVWCGVEVFPVKGGVYLPPFWCLCSTGVFWRLALPCGMHGHQFEMSPIKYAKTKIKGSSNDLPRHIGKRGLEMPLVFGAYTRKWEAL
jgi:hypothetical protein